MIKCKIYSCFDDRMSMEKMITLYYDTYKVIDVKFSTAIDATFNRVNYSVMIVYKEK